MNRTELEEIIKSCDVNIAKLELAKAEAAKELEKKDEAPEYYETQDGEMLYFVFKTKKIAQLFEEKIQLIADQLYFKELHDADYVPNWNDSVKGKWYIRFNSRSSKYEYSNCSYLQNEETVYFSSKEITQKCADWLNERSKA